MKTTELAREAATAFYPDLVIRTAISQAVTAAVAQQQVNAASTIEGQRITHEREVKAFEAEIARLKGRVKELGDFISNEENWAQRYAKDCWKAEAERDALRAEVASVRADATTAKEIEACTRKDYQDLAQFICALCGELREAQAALAAAREDAERLDWLEHVLCYPMVCLDGRTSMEMLPNRGKGFANGELRAAIDAARNKGEQP